MAGRGPQHNGWSVAASGADRPEDPNLVAPDDEVRYVPAALERRMGHVDSRLVQSLGHDPGPALFQDRLPREELT